MKNLQKILFYIALASIFMSCSKFDKLLKSKDYKLMYQKGIEYYEKKDHHKYTALFEQLIRIYQGTEQADTVAFYLSEGYYHQGDYLLAAHFYDRFRNSYPRSAFTEQAEYMYAYCHYRSSPRPQLDQETTNQALAAFAEYTAKYPDSPRKAEVNRIVHELRDKLVRKSYESAKIYYEMKEYKSAITALKGSLRKFPDSEYREEQLYLILSASYSLAANSVPEKRRERFQNTLDEYYNFVSEFPESKYKRDAEKIYAHCVNVVEK